MGADRETVRLVSQALKVEEDRRIGRKGHFAAAGQVKDLASLAAVERALGDPDHRHIVNAHVLHHLADRRQLALAAVDQNQVRPFAALAVGIVLLQPGEAPFQDLAHHREIVAGLGLRPLDVELAIVALAEALGPGDDHRAGRVGTHDVAVVINFDPFRNIA